MPSDKDRVTKLNDSNYLRWKYDVEIALRSKGLWSIVDGSRVEPEDQPRLFGDQGASSSRVSTSSSSVALSADPIAFTEDNFKALKVIADSLSDKYHQYILNTLSAKDAWSRVIKMHENATELNVNVLMRQYHSLPFEQDTSAYMSKLRLCINNLKSVGKTISDSEAIAKIIKDFEQAKAHTTFCAFYKLNSIKSSFELTLDEAEQMIKAVTAEEESHDEGVALATSSKDKEKRPSGNRKFCKYCKKQGHVISECYKREAANSNQACSNVVPETFLSLATVTAQDRVDDFFVDTAASNHQTFNKSLLSNIRAPSPNERFIAGNTVAGQVEVKAVGDIYCEMWNGTSWTSVKISSVKYAPDANFNLFSVGALPEHISCITKSGTMSFYSGSNEQPFCVALKNQTAFRNMFSIKLRLKAKPQNVALVNHKPVDSLPIQPERFVHSDPARITRMAVDESVKAVPAKAKVEPKLEQPVPEPSEPNQVPSEPTTPPTVVPKKAGKKQYQVDPERLAYLHSQAFLQEPEPQAPVPSASPPGEPSSPPFESQSKPAPEPSFSTDTDEGFHIKPDEVSIPPVNFTDQVDVVCVAVSSDEPTSFHEAVVSEDSNQRWLALEREYFALLNGHRTLTNSLQGIAPADVQWMFQLQVPGDSIRYEAHPIVVPDFVQPPGHVSNCVRLEIPFDRGKHNITEHNRQAVGSLVWLASQTRPDLAYGISYAISLLSRFLANQFQAQPTL